MRVTLQLVSCVRCQEASRQRAAGHGQRSCTSRGSCFVVCFGHIPLPLVPQKTSSGGLNHSLIGLFCTLQWAARALSVSQSLMRMAWVS